MISNPLPPFSDVYVRACVCAYGEFKDFENNDYAIIA